MNAARPPLVRSIPFWGLVVLSLASIAVGGWVALSQIGSMNAALTAGTATGVEVYGGQSIAVIGSIVLGAGVVGLLLALAVASARALVPATSIAALEAIEPVEVIEPIAVIEPLPDDRSTHDEPAVAEDAVAPVVADADDARVVPETDAVPAAR
ncbi:MAG TPA: hypothetical protein VNT50_04985 [Microbacterium sp.]|uniref:hypothetical protein n=1 Tax=Microbacterium sp. TaxID=51671 RepID=UPI002C889C6C|nr:hypothetical protein [Microbacterium sp.]HWI30822.1 hypothetical protein [Microbacterium sp.]